MRTDVQEDADLELCMLSGLSVTKDGKVIYIRKVVCKQCTKFTAIRYTLIPFSKPSFQNCEPSAFEYRIDTRNHVPVSAVPRQLRFLEREVHTQIDEMMQSGIIEPSKSPWSSPSYSLIRKIASFVFV